MALTLLQALAVQVQQRECGAEQEHFALDQIAVPQARGRIEGQCAREERHEPVEQIALGTHAQRRKVRVHLAQCLGEQ